MADRIQQVALSGSRQPDQRQTGEEFDLAAPKPKMKIPDCENYETKKEDLPGPARPKASACPPQSEQTVIKRQASQESRLQPPPSHFLSPEDQNQRGEQRPDAAKKARSPFPPEELRARARMKFPRDEDMDVIHFPAPSFLVANTKDLSMHRKGMRSKLHAL